MTIGEQIERFVDRAPILCGVSFLPLRDILQSQCEDKVLDNRFHIRLTLPSFQAGDKRVTIAERGGKVALGHPAALAQLFEERAKSDGSSWMNGSP